jgi:glutamate N-acetyltransferase/amino-acid N-acetyltransferase
VSGKKSSGYKTLDKMVFEVMKRLSVMIVRDGEGATKLVTVKLLNARSVSDARKAAFRVSNSPLVKTAFFGEDFNWGRIMAALGSSDAVFDPEQVEICFNGIQAVACGQAVQENITELKKTVREKEIVLSISLNAGEKSFETMTCDLTIDYVKINAEYTT